MNANCFYLPKRTDTHADALAVAGLAHLLANLGTTAARSVTIYDRGPHYELKTDRPLTNEDVQRWDGDPFYPYIRLKGDNVAPPDHFDYEEESRILLEARKAKASKGRSRGKPSPIASTEAAALHEASRAPDPETALLRVFNGMRKGFKGDIAFNVAIRKQPPRDAVISRLITLSQPPENGQGNAADKCPLQIKLKASQWFLPLAGKGVSRVKANGASPGQFREELLDWFETWLRFIGMYRCMTSHGVGDDLKVAAIEPAEIDEDLLPRVRAHLREQSIFGGKIDVRAPIELARALVEHCEERLGLTPGHRLVRFAGARTCEVVRGLHVTTYKKMGTSSSVMNIAFLGLPSWAALKSRADAEEFLKDLDQLDKFQQPLQDDISEDIETLREMRDFVSSGDQRAALEFFARSAFCVMQRLAAGKYAVIFQTATVRRILMGLSDSNPQAQSIEPIISDAGFLRLAKAVRAATIHAQLHDDSVVQPRYGLAQTWRQQSAFKERFVQTLSDFVQRFNADVVRQREIDRKASRARPFYPALVTDDDLASVLRQIEAHGSSLVAHLLLAFGFAQVAKTDDDQKDTPSAQ